MVCRICGRKTGEGITLCYECYYRDIQPITEYNFSEEFDFDVLSENQMSCLYYILGKLECGEKVTRELYESICRSFCNSFPSVDVLVDADVLNKPPHSMDYVLGFHGSQLLLSDVLKKQWLDLEPKTRRMLIHSHGKTIELRLRRMNPIDSDILLYGKSVLTYRMGDGNRDKLESRVNSLSKTTVPIKTVEHYIYSVYIHRSEQNWSHLKYTFRPLKYWFKYINDRLFRQRIKVPKNMLYALFEDKIDDRNKEVHTCRLGINPEECSKQWKQSQSVSAYAHKDIELLFNTFTVSARCYLTNFGGVTFEVRNISCEDLPKLKKFWVESSYDTRIEYIHDNPAMNSIKDLFNEVRDVHKFVISQAVTNLSKSISEYIDKNLRDINIKAA